MTIEVDLDELKTLVQSPVKAAQLQLFATHGEQVTQDHLGAETTLTIDQKNMIALYLAAHFYTLSHDHGGIKRRRIGESEEEYKSVAADKVGFLSTSFGQQAVALDTSRTLLNSSYQWSADVAFESIHPGRKSS